MSSQLSRTSRRSPSSSADLTFKVASEEWEFEQIHRLNYETFVEEIPQHERNSRRVLVDRFHDQNTYFICLKSDRLLGMVAARDQRPFSLDQKLKNLDSYLPFGSSVCEIRLLSIDKRHRSGRMIQGLLSILAIHCLKKGYEVAIISGTVQQERLYRRLGFERFGPRVGTARALYQPMYRKLATLKEEFARLLRLAPGARQSPGSVSFLPGPVAVRDEVREAFASQPVSHRGPDFVADVGRIKGRLCEMTGASRVEILMGSGTMANDVIAGQLSLASKRGLIVSNGEFGDRLLDHAARMRLAFDSLELEWGTSIERGRIEAALDRGPAYDWLWAVHCETSTGVLNDLEMLRETCAGRRVELVMDCISSAGTVPLDLKGVLYASSVSGKGLGAFPGLSMVFYHHEVEPAPGALPRYLDLGLHASKDGVPFTMSSNLMYALDAALDRFESTEVFDEIADVSTRLRRGLREAGYTIVALDEHSSPAVITIELPEDASSVEAGRRLQEAGYLLSYNSDYLRRRNWIQVCLMGQLSSELVAPLLAAMREALPARAKPTAAGPPAGPRRPKSSSAGEVLAGGNHRGLEDADVER